MRKVFAVYKNSKLQEEDIWHVHRKYDSMEKAKQALGDLIKKPRKERVWRYTILPVTEPNIRTIKIKKEYVQDLLSIAR